MSKKSIETIGAAYIKTAKGEILACEWFWSKDLDIYYNEILDQLHGEYLEKN